MSKQFDRGVLLEQIPQIANITNEAWREKVIEAWELAFNDSNFETLETVRFNKAYDNVTLLQHTRSVVEMSLELAKNIHKEYGYDISLDEIICISSLHDISKLRETDPDGKGGIKKSKIGEQFQHAFFSAHYALLVGLPEKIVSAIFSHTGNTKKSPTSLEGIIVAYADLSDADMHRFLNGRPMHVSKLH